MRELPSTNAITKRCGPSPPSSQVSRLVGAVGEISRLGAQSRRCNIESYYYGGKSKDHRTRGQMPEILHTLPVFIDRTCHLESELSWFLPWGAVGLFGVAGSL